MNAEHTAVGVVALSMADPSPHSLKVVIRCQCVVVDATMLVTSVVNRAASRESRGPASPAFQNPGLTVKLWVPCWSAWTSGLYWCQSSGWVVQLAKPGPTFITM
jgi:hypothetical protein